MSGITEILEKTGRYRVLDRLGSGGMATVYKAKDTNLQRHVAIKVLHEHLSYEAAFQERFEREARFIAGFNHPNIVHVYDFSMMEDDDHKFYYMVMPYISGETLADLLDEHCDNNIPIPHQRVHQIMRELASALGYAHERNMIHRDVKPGNILFDENNRTILTDFGIARLVQQSGLTQDGLIVGTPAYMSPEQATGQDVDARSDLYALGVILFELLTGEPPFEDDGTISLLLKHVNAPVPRVSDRMHVPNANLDELVHKALAKNPDDRYQTAEEFAEDIEAAFSGKTPGHIVKKPERHPAKNDFVDDPSTVIMSAQPAPIIEKPGRHTTTAILQTITVDLVKPVRKNPLGLIALAIAVVALLLVGRAADNTNSISTLVPAAQTQATAEVAASMTGPSYFTTDFEADDTYNTYWQQESTPSIQRSFTEDGEFILENIEPGTASSTLFDPMYTYTDTSVTMMATLNEESARSSAYGIIFRYQDNDNYNVFAVDSQQRYSIWVRNEGVWQELRDAGSNWEFHEAVNLAGTENTLHIKIKDNMLTGSVNDVELVRLEDDTFVEGAIGIYLATPSQGTAEVAIDHFDVAELVAESMTGDSVESMTGEDTVESMTGEDSE